MERASNVIFFDVDGVVLHPGLRIRRSAQPWYASLQQDLGIDPEALSARFFIPAPGTPSPMEACATGKVGIRDILPAMLAELGYTGSLDSFLGYWFEHDAFIDQDLLCAVARLREEHDFACYLATSQEHCRARYIWDDLGMSSHFSGMYYTARIGHSKRSPEFYRAVGASLNLGDTSPIYFDDRPAFVQIASSAGWDASLYESLSSLTAHPRLADAFGRTRNSLSSTSGRQGP